MVFFMATIFGDVQYSQMGQWHQPLSDRNSHPEIGRNIGDDAPVLRGMVRQPIFSTIYPGM